MPDLERYILDITSHYTIKKAALDALYNLCLAHGNFKNGVEHQGIDEGEVYASGILDQVQSALLIPFPRREDYES